MEKTYAVGNVQPCCKDLSNRVSMPDRGPGMKVQKCGVCGRNHYRLIAEPGRIGMKGNPLGGLT